MNRITLKLIPVLLLGACATTPTSAPAPKTAAPLPEEKHLADLRQLTFGGENAEAYWSFDGKQLSLQSRTGDMGCDRIYRMDVSQDPPVPVPVSSGKGATTCAHFMPGDKEIVYSSTHQGGDACPPKPDMSLGYVWALYDTYDIYKISADGTGMVQLTTEKGYDAEATVCGKDGSIIFTSVRDGDIELYRMDKDGKNVKRLTNTPGYDGGAFFSQDCSKIVWRASRPAPGPELDDYKKLLSQGLVRPSKLELFVANADGSEPVQVTYLNSATFAPYFHPSGKRILFSTNYGDPKGREFDIWAVNVDGTQLERITYAPGFDGFPMFSPDGKTLAFSSNRATAPGQRDTNVFLARWVDSEPVAEERAPDRIMKDAKWLADPARQGRGIGLPGLEAAGAWLEERFKSLGLEPAGDNGTYRQSFPVVTSVKVAEGTKLVIDGKAVVAENFLPLGFSAQSSVKGALVLANYGLRDEKLGVDDYAKLDVKGKIVVVRRFVPETEAFAETDKKRRAGDIRNKAWVAKERGAAALLVVDWPTAPEGSPKDWTLPKEAALPGLHPEGVGDAGIPVLVLKRAALEPVYDKLSAKKKVQAELAVALSHEQTPAFNVVAKLPAAAAKPDGAIVISAHYDHLGMGGKDSLAPEKHEPHVGADDNASGVSTILEVARTLAARRSELSRDVYFIGFTGEESGLLGSTQFTRARGDEGMKQIAAMFDIDMVGRLRNNQLSVMGSESADEWGTLVEAACKKQRIHCTAGGDGYGPGDRTPFYASGVVVLHMFTGSHSDYHKPSDTADKLNVAGAAQIAGLITELAVGVANGPRLTYRKAPSPAPRGDLRSFNASLGTVPDYAGPPAGQKGMLLAGVRPGGAAELGGMKRGDILIRLGKHDVGGVEDLMYALNVHKPGETVTAVVLREGKQVNLEVTFQESKRR